jgi:hypothetical protein
VKCPQGGFHLAGIDFYPFFGKNIEFPQTSRTLFPQDFPFVIAVALIQNGQWNPQKRFPVEINKDPFNDGGIFKIY